MDNQRVRSLVELQGAIYEANKHELLMVYMDIYGLTTDDSYGTVDYPELQ